MARSSRDRKKVVDVVTIPRGEADVTIVQLPNKAKVSRLEKNALAKVGEAKEIAVVDDQTYAIAGEFAKTCKEFEDMVHQLYDEHVANAHTSHKALTSARANLLKPFEEARQIVERNMGGYALEQRRIAQAKADKEAEAQRTKDIKRALRSGDKELAEELTDEPLETVTIKMATPVIAGIASIPTVKFEVVNAAKVPRKFLMVDEKAIKAHLKIHGAGAVIDGVRVYEEMQTQTRS